MNKPVIVIHGGAGTIQITKANVALIEQHLQQLKTIINANYQSLLSGKLALDVVEETVIALENYEGFNAGRGSVLNADGVAEMDASIMDGRNRTAGAVAAIMRAKNPISGARAVMEYSEHVLLAGANADKFCQQHAIEMKDTSYFITEHRKKQLQQMQTQGHPLDLDSLGTVGAVACDIYGNLAAATSTGGKANKIPGRVGDSPIIGAGIWADNKTCAVSATGDGEIFIRTLFAHEIAAMMTHKNLDLKNVCDAVLQQVAAFNGEGGCIAIDSQGEIVMAFNTAGMYRAWVDKKGIAHALVATQ